MIRSMQEQFLKVYAEGFKATAERIARRLDVKTDSDAYKIIEDELRGLYHGSLVVFDGGSSLADHGLIYIVDEDNHVFDRNLHEICFKQWPTADR